jgi:hypothetical protein
VVARRPPSALPRVAMIKPARSVTAVFTDARRELIGRALTLLAWAVLLFAWIWLNVNQVNGVDFFQDARVYWRFDFDNLYGRGTVGGRDAYLYSPAFAQLFSPLGILPWPAFKALWSAANLLVLAWLCGPRIAAVILFTPFVADEISTGNLHLLIAAAMVLAFRYPASYAFVLLTKVSPGVGLAWFVGRREWRPLLVAILTTAVISLISFVLAPTLWFEWFDSLRANAGVVIPGYAVAIPGPVLVRVVIGTVMALVAGILGWRWLVPVAGFVALPVPWLSGLSMLAGSIALLRGLPFDRRVTERYANDERRGEPALRRWIRRPG